MSVAQRAQEMSEDAAAFFQEEKPGIWLPPRPKSNDSFDQTDEAQAFPVVDPLMKPLGSRVLVQLRQAIAVSRAGLRMPEEVRQADADNMVVAKVIAVGSLAFRNRDTGKEWPEGSWCNVGDYVRVPKYQQDLFQRPFDRVEVGEDRRGRPTRETVKDQVIFATVRDLDILGIYPNAEAALAERAFV